MKIPTQHHQAKTKEKNMSTLVRYMKDNKGRTRGCIVCTGKDPKYGKGNMYAYKIGISFCNPKDNFDKKTALNIAIGRAKNSSINANVPKNMAAILHDEWDRMLVRARKYYK